MLSEIDPLVYSLVRMARQTQESNNRAKTAFGLDPPDKQRDNGYNVWTVSADGERLGLYGHFVALGWARPEQVTSILARDGWEMPRPGSSASPMADR